MAKQTYGVLTNHLFDPSDPTHRSRPLHLSAVTGRLTVPDGYLSLIRKVSPNQGRKADAKYL